MDVYTEEIFGPVLSVLRADTVDEAIDADQRQPVRQRHRDLHLQRRGGAAVPARRHVGMIGINVPIPVPMAYYSFGGWKDSLFGDKHVHGPEGVSFYTRGEGRHRAAGRTSSTRTGASMPLPDRCLGASASHSDRRTSSMSRATQGRPRSALVAGRRRSSLAGCSSTGGKEAEETRPAVGAGKADTPKITIAMVTHGAPGDTFWDIIRKGAEAAAAKDNVDAEVLVATRTPASRPP